MARLTLVTLSALLSIAATAGVIFALAGRNRAGRRSAQTEPRTCPMFELLMQ
jgi:hypothetical protein